MSIIVQQLRREIRFTISGALCQSISNWESALDEQVFNKQLKTGIFRGRLLDSETLKIMQMAKDRGEVVPYYGVGGSRGACTYSLRMTDTGYTVKVENIEASESVEFSDSPSQQLEESNATEPRMVFKIDGQEYQNLRQWEYWSEQEATTSRYVYHFGRVSLERLGYTVKVEDTLTGNNIDVTDYEGW